MFLDGVLSKYPVISIPTSDIVDSNGAGDAFIGGMIVFFLLFLKKYYLYIILFVLGFVSKYVLGCSTDECVNAGIKAGSYIIQQPGMSKDDSFNLNV